MLNVQNNISNFLFLTEVGEANYLHLLFSFIPLVNRSFIHHVLDTCIVPGPVGSHWLYNITNHELGGGGGAKAHVSERLYFFQNYQPSCSLQDSSHFFPSDFFCIDHL